MLRALMPRLSLALALLALLALPGCQRKIGAPCRVSTDCSIRGDRVCDLSHLVDGQGNLDPKGKGECTIDSCNTSTCPREGTCVQIYGAEFLSVACDPELEDRPQAFDEDALHERIATCHADPPVPTDDDGVPLYTNAKGEPTYKDGQAVACNDCSSYEICLPEGLCADVLSARTSCRKRCRSGAQCRDGYECRTTGSNGIYAVSSPAHPFGADDVKICMPIRPLPGDEE
jgi:hypothetical protein